MIRDGEAIAMRRVGALVARRQWVYMRDLLVTLVDREMKLRYKRSVLGIAWSLLTPLAQLAVFYLIWNVLLPLNNTGLRDNAAWLVGMEVNF